MTTDDHAAQKKVRSRNVIDQIIYEGFMNLGEALAGCALKFWRKLAQRLKPSREIFLTYAVGDWCAVGTTHCNARGTWIVTAIRCEPRTALIGGGSVPCWSVRGKLVPAAPVHPVNPVKIPTRDQS